MSAPKTPLEPLERAAVKAFRALWRLLQACVHVIRGWLTITLVFGRLSPAQRAGRVERWAQEMLRLLGIRLQVQGTVPSTGPVLLVSNHISWLDIVVIHAARHCRFVSKAEVHHWPFIGRLASGAGTLFIERASRRDALRVVHHMTERLKAGDMLAVFPEGTTSDGTSMLPFHSNLIQAAISADQAVLPMALRFEETATGQLSLAPSYVGDDTLLLSLWRTLTAPPLTAVVRFGVPSSAQGRNRRTWASALEAEVNALRSGSSVSSV